MDDKISAVVGKLQQRLGDDYEVRIVDVTKNNDTVKKGISVRKNGEKIGRIYYWNGEALEAFLGDVESSPLPDIDFEIPETLFILSNETRQFGAICMLYPEVLKKFCVEKMIDGVFVIPSSIHEVLLMIADKNKVDVGYIRQMIKEVNYENVSEVERLSDSPYYYDVATDTLRIAE